VMVSQNNVTDENFMKTKEIIKRARELAKPFRVTKGKDFRLKDVDPDDTLEFTKEADKPRAKEALAMGVAALAELQDKLYAQDKWAVLLIFQAMDAAGKDGAIKHVMSGVNPQGCEVYSFKSPSSEDLDHDYLWRCMKCLPNRGHIGIFNRSYYEEVLVVRVHPEFLAKQKTAAKTGWQRNLGRSLRRHPQFRAIPDKEWRHRAEILSSRFKERTETTISRPNRRSIEKLEVLVQ
jgi:polyphosphate kinase 2 (PPK2 family)